MSLDSLFRVIGLAIIEQLQCGERVDVQPLVDALETCGWDNGSIRAIRYEMQRGTWFNTKTKAKLLRRAANFLRGET